jgi:hypothetical protein
MEPTTEKFLAAMMTLSFTGITRGKTLTPAGEIINGEMENLADLIVTLLPNPTDTLDLPSLLKLKNWLIENDDTIYGHLGCEDILESLIEQLATRNWVIYIDTSNEFRYTFSQKPRTPPMS